MTFFLWYVILKTTKRNGANAQGVAIMARHLNYNRQCRDNFRKLGGRFQISDYFIQILYGDRCLKCVYIEPFFTYRIADCLAVANDIIGQMSKKERAKLKNY